MERGDILEMMGRLKLNGMRLAYRTQSALAARGYDVGTPDGINGPRT